MLLTVEHNKQQQLNRQQQLNSSIVSLAVTVKEAAAECGHQPGWHAATH
jgi:hypothetical protein